MDMQHCRAIPRNIWHRKKGHCLLLSIKMVKGCRQPSQDLLCQASYCEQPQFILWEESRSSSGLRYIIILLCFSNTRLGRLPHLKGAFKMSLTAWTEQRKEKRWLNACQRCRPYAGELPSSLPDLHSWPQASLISRSRKALNGPARGSHPRGLHPQLYRQHVLQNNFGSSPRNRIIECEWDNCGHFIAGE